MTGNKLSLLSRPSIHDYGLVTSVVPYGESDCIVRLLLPKEGRLVAFYRRGLQSGKNRPGVIQAPCFAYISYVASDPNKLAKIRACDIDPAGLPSFNSLRTFGFFCYTAEIIERFLPEQQPAREIFELTKDVYSSLTILGDDAAILRAFELKLLDFCGYLPEIPDNLTNEESFGYNPVSCRFQQNIEENLIHFTGKSLSLVNHMMRSKIGEINSLDPAVAKMIGGIFMARLRLMGGDPLKSVVFLKQLERVVPCA